MKFGIIGCGLIGKKRLKALLKRAEAVSLFDTNQEQAKKLAEEFPAPLAKNLDEILTDKSIEAVVVATTHEHLASIAALALNQGKHVFLEKPGARNAKEILPLLNTAEKNKRIIQVGFNHRFHPAISRAKEIIENGEIGPLLYLRGRYGHGGRLGYEKEWRADQKKSGGGELLDQGSHLIDLSSWFFAEKFCGIMGKVHTYFWKMPVEDNAFLTLETTSGKIAHLHASWTEWKNLFCLEIFGTTGKLQIDGLGGSYGTEKLTFYKMKPEMGPPDILTWDFPGEDISWEKEMDSFLENIGQNMITKGATLQDCYATLKVIDDVYRTTGLAGKAR